MNDSLLKRMRERDAAAALQRQTGFAGQFRNQMNPSAGDYGGRDPNAVIYGQARGAGYSPEVANIMGESMVVEGSRLPNAATPWRAEMMPQGPLVARGELEPANMGIDRGLLEARANQERIAAITGARVDQGAMGMTRDLRGMAGQAMTQEAQGRFLANREGDWQRRMDYAQRERVFGREAALKKSEQDILTQEQSGRRLLERDVMEKMGPQYDEQGNYVGFLGPKGDFTQPEAAGSSRPLTPIGKLNEDLAAGRITQEQFQAEMDRRKQEMSNAERYMVAMGLGPSSTTSTAEVPEIFKWTRDGKKVVSRDGGKTFDYVK